MKQPLTGSRASCFDAFSSREPVPTSLENALFCVRLRRSLRGMPSAFQDYGMNVAAIVRLVAMHRAAVAVETRVGVGVDTEIVDHQHAGIFQPHADEAGEIEHRVAIALCGNEEHRVIGIMLDET